jgi:hypothetical protein
MLIKISWHFILKMRLVTGGRVMQAVPPATGWYEVTVPVDGLRRAGKAANEFAKKDTRGDSAARIG